MLNKWCLVSLFYLYHLSDASHPDLCEDAKIDTITRVNDGSTYVFKGNSCWKVLSNGGFASGYPKYISDIWEELPSDLDASYTWPGSNTFFFKGKHFWAFNNTHDKFGPGWIESAFTDIPNELDAALVWGKNNKLYFFKGDSYYSYDDTNPRPITAWSSKLAGGIDAAFQWENGKTYFFKEDMYYRYDDTTENIEVDPPYPRSTVTEWFNCP